MKPEDYFDITHVEGVTPEMIKEYKRLVRHERYCEETDAKHLTYHYGYEDEIGYLVTKGYKLMDSPYNNAELILKLKKALAMLKEENELWYEAIIAYFYSDEETSYSIIAKSVNVSKQTIFLRVQNGLSYLRKILSEEGYDTVDDV